MLTLISRSVSVSAQGPVSQECAVEGCVLVPLISEGSARRRRQQRDMAVYETVALADMTFNEAEQLYTYLCPCGDLFEITLEELYDGEDIAPCPSCSLKIRVLFEEAQLPPMLTGADPADKTGGAGAGPSTAVGVAA